MLSDKLKALGHPVRLEIIKYLARCTECCCGEVCGCLPLAQSTVSQHLDVLKKAGLVKSWADGNRSLFALDRDALNEVHLHLMELTTSTDPKPAITKEKEC